MTKPKPPVEARLDWLEELTHGLGAGINSVIKRLGALEKDVIETNKDLKALCDLVRKRL